MGIADTCKAIETFFGAVDLDLRSAVLKPQSKTAIAAAEKKLATPFPADVRAFLARGLRGKQGAIDEPFASIGFDFLDVKQIVKHTQMLRDIDASEPHASVIRGGIALTFEEPELVVTPGGVYHFSFRNKLLKIAPSWEAFLAHWLAAGCFASHSFDACWAAVRAHVPAGGVSPGKNTWVRAYKKQFPDL